MGLARGQLAGRLAGVDLVRREHAQGGQRVPVVVPGVEAGPQRQLELCTGDN